MVAWVVAANAILWGASDARPVVPLGATKQEVIDAYGWPNGQSQAGTKEILSYAQGEVILDHGRVERVNFSRDVPWQAPRPRPAAPTPSTRKEHELPVDIWRTSFADALREAQDRHVRILALFTNSDESPPSRQFHDEVEDSPEFAEAFAGDFVFLKLDFPHGVLVTPGQVIEHNRLRQKYGVTTYPSLLILSSTGDLQRRVDLRERPGADSLRVSAIAVVREARDSKAPPDGAANPPPDSLKREFDALSVSPTAPAMWTARRLIALALILGGVLAALMFIRLSRQLKVKAPKPVQGMAERIADAASGVPLPDEMVGWSKEQLRTTAAALAELEGYSVIFRPSTGDVDLELRKAGDLNPRVLVVCWPAAANHVPAKTIRELFANFTAEGAEAGWLVSPTQFAGEVRSYAASHAITLMDGNRLHEMLRDVPPVVLTTILPKPGIADSE